MILHIYKRLIHLNIQGPPKGKQVKSESKDDNRELKKFRDNCKIVFLFPDLDSKKVCKPINHYNKVTGCVFVSVCVPKDLANR